MQISLGHRRPFPRRTQILGVLASLLLLDGTGHAATLRLAADGSGDFTQLHQAVGAAASGDTIRVAPGEYTEPGDYVSIRGNPFQAMAFVAVEELTILGDSREGVLIGPAAPSATNKTAPYGINHDSTVARRLVVRDLTFQNSYGGVHLFADGEVTQCSFVTCGIGVYVATAGRALVRDCRFERNDDGVVLANHPTPASAVVADCTFVENVYASRLTADGAILENGRFRGDRIGTYAYCTGCEIRDCVYQDIVLFGLEAHEAPVLNGCEFLGTSEANVFVHDHLSGTGNLLQGGRFATIMTAPDATFAFRGNHILNAGGWSVWMPEGWLTLPYGVLDLSDNYWGTGEATQIDDWILDGSDTERIKTKVRFAPFLMAGPVPTESMSFGALKARY